MHRVHNMDSVIKDLPYLHYSPLVPWHLTGGDILYNRLLE